MICIVFNSFILDFASLMNVWETFATICECNAPAS